VQERLFKEKYPIHAIEIAKTETTCTDVDSIVALIKESVKAHPVAAYIGIFDHYTHTSSLEDGEIASDILDAKNVLFCFGKELNNPMVLAVRPRAIGIAQKPESFVLSFLEAPNLAANEAMQKRCKSIRDV